MHVKTKTRVQNVNKLWQTPVLFKCTCFPAFSFSSLLWISLFSKFGQNLHNLFWSREYVLKGSRKEKKNKRHFLGTPLTNYETRLYSIKLLDKLSFSYLPSHKWQKVLTNIWRHFSHVCARVKKLCHKVLSMSGIGKNRKWTYPREPRRQPLLCRARIGGQPISGSLRAADGRPFQPFSVYPWLDSLHSHHIQDHQDRPLWHTDNRVREAGKIPI